MRGLPVGLPPVQTTRPPGRLRGAVFFVITFAAVFLAAMQVIGAFAG